MEKDVYCIELDKRVKAEADKEAERSRMYFSDLVQHALICLMRARRLKRELSK